MKGQNLITRVLLFGAFASLLVLGACKKEEEILPDFVVQRSSKSIHNGVEFDWNRDGNPDFIHLAMHSHTNSRDSAKQEFYACTLYQEFERIHKKMEFAIYNNGQILKLDDPITDDLTWEKSPQWLDIFFHMYPNFRDTVVNIDIFKDNDRMGYVAIRWTNNGKVEYGWARINESYGSFFIYELVYYRGERSPLLIGQTE